MLSWLYIVTEPCMESLYKYLLYSWWEAMSRSLKKQDRAGSGVEKQFCHLFKNCLFFKSWKIYCKIWVVKSMQGYRPATLYCRSPGCGQERHIQSSGLVSVATGIADAGHCGNKITAIFFTLLMCWEPLFPVWNKTLILTPLLPVWRQNPL